MRKSLYFLLSIVLYAGVFLFTFNRVNVLADDLDEKVNEIMESEADGYLSYDEEDQQDDDSILSDDIQSVTRFEEDQINDTFGDSFSEHREEDESAAEDELIDEIRPIKSGSRSMVNTYDGSKTYKFDWAYYQVTKNLLLSYDNGNDYYTNNIFIFQKEKKPDFDLIEIFVNLNSRRILLDSPKNDYYIVYYQKEGGIVDNNSVISAVATYLDQYGYPDSNCYWSAPDEPEPTPTPDPTPTPNPDNIVVETDKSASVMIIFALGLVAGCIAGHFLTGFIK